MSRLRPRWRSEAAPAATANGSTVRPLRRCRRGSISGVDPTDLRDRVTRTSAKARVTGRMRESSVEHPLDRRGGVELQVAALPQQHDAQRVVQLGVGEHDALDRHVAVCLRALAVEQLQLVPHVGRCVEQEPVRPVGADGGGRLDRGRARAGSMRAARQVGHQQFHWGNPPPAAVPSRTTCTWKSTEGPLSRAPRR